MPVVKIKNPLTGEFEQYPKQLPVVQAATPDIQVGTTQTLPAGSPATVTRRADSPDTAPVFDFGIPRGDNAISRLLVTFPANGWITPASPAKDDYKYSCTVQVEQMSSAYDGVIYDMNIGKTKAEKHRNTAMAAHIRNIVTGDGFITAYGYAQPPADCTVALELRPPGDMCVICFFDWDDTMLGTIAVPKCADARAAVNRFGLSMVHPDLREQTVGQRSSFARLDTYRGEYPAEGPDGTTVRQDGGHYPLSNKLDYVFYGKSNHQSYPYASGWVRATSLDELKELWTTLDSQDASLGTFDFGAGMTSLDEDVSTVYVKAAYAPGDSLKRDHYSLTPFSYELYTLPTYDSGVYSIKGAYLRMNTDGYGVKRARKPVVTATMQADVPGASAFPFEIDVCNADSIEVTIHASKNISTIDYALVEKYGADFTTGGLLSLRSGNGALVNYEKEIGSGGFVYRASWTYFRGQVELKLKGESNEFDLSHITGGLLNDCGFMNLDKKYFSGPDVMDAVEYDIPDLIDKAIEAGLSALTFYQLQYGIFDYGNLKDAKEAEQWYWNEFYPGSDRSLGKVYTPAQSTILFYDWDDTLIGSMAVPKKTDVRDMVNSYVKNTFIHPELRNQTAEQLSSIARTDTYRGKYPHTGPDPEAPLSTGGANTVLDGELFPLTNKLDYVFYGRTQSVGHPYSCGWVEADRNNLEDTFTALAAEEAVVCVDFSKGVNTDELCVKAAYSPGSHLAHFLDAGSAKRNLYTFSGIKARYYRPNDIRNVVVNAELSRINFFGYGTPVEAGLVVLNSDVIAASNRTDLRPYTISESLPISIMVPSAASQLSLHLVSTLLSEGNALTGTIVSQSCTLSRVDLSTEAVHMGFVAEARMAQMNEYGRQHVDKLNREGVIQPLWNTMVAQAFFSDMELESTVIEIGSQNPAADTFTKQMKIARNRMIACRAGRGNRDVTYSETIAAIKMNTESYVSSDIGASYLKFRVQSLVDAYVIKDSDLSELQICAILRFITENLGDTPERKLTSEEIAALLSTPEV